MARKNRKPSLVKARRLQSQKLATMHANLTSDELVRLRNMHDTIYYAGGYASIVNGQARRRLPTNRLFKRAIEDRDNARNNAAYTRRLMHPSKARH